MINDDANDWFASQGQQIQDFEAPIPPEEEPVEEAEVIDEDRPYGTHQRLRRTMWRT